MALAENKETSFARVLPEERHVPGLFSLEHLPGPGRDHEGRQAKWDIITALSSLLQEGQNENFKEYFIKFLDEGCITGPERARFKDASLKDRVNEIKAVLDVEWRNNGRRYYYATLLPKAEEQREAAMATLESLRDMLSPYIVFLGLSENLTIHSNETRKYGNVAKLRRITP